MQRFTDALPEELQMHTYGISRDYNHVFMSLSRIQTLGKKDKPRMTWRPRRVEHMNEVSDGAGVYHDEDLSMEVVVQAIQV
jgi:hypothetical protein